MNRAVWVGATIVAGFLWWPLAAGPPVIAAVRRLRPALQARDTRRRRSEAMPDVIDLVHVAISSGDTIPGALRLVAEAGPIAVRPSMHEARRQLEAGATLHEVLDLIPQTLGPDYRSLAVTLDQAQREGSPIGALLIRLSDEAASARRLQGERAAKRLPVQMLLPLVLCSLPAVVFGAVVPLVLVSLRRL